MQSLTYSFYLLLPYLKKEVFFAILLFIPTQFILVI